MRQLHSVITILVVHVVCGVDLEEKPLEDVLRSSDIKFFLNVTPAAHFSSMGVNKTIFLSTEKTDGSVAQSKWSMEEPPAIMGNTFAQCNLRPFHWANASSGRLLHLARVQADRMFDSSRTRRINSNLDAAQRNLLDEKLLSARYFPKTTTVDCYLLFVYSTKCPFSIATFPYVKALARSYPQLRVHAVHVDDYLVHRWSLRMLFVPKLELIVDHRIFREYSGSDTSLDGMIDFVWLNIRQMPKGPVGLQPEDYKQNPPFPEPGSDVCLIISWITTIAGLLYIYLQFGSNLRVFLSDLLYRISCGRIGKPSTVNLGAILSWDSGQIAPVMR
ncbi:hypothetical protein PHET_09987 [Paragonimus heterotremus]|uniref:Thioredoxin domain-containing protein n=1 Tax=Paragonimus heterotremus TaxID=100268 RepID=A0A8J4WSM2_9TREM|nr:hypothetical protein PHET_09987 [Paragonimus heterotremus]